MDGEKLSGGCGMVRGRASTQCRLGCSDPQCAYASYATYDMKICVLQWLKQSRSRWALAAGEVGMALRAVLKLGDFAERLFANGAVIHQSFVWV